MKIPLTIFNILLLISSFGQQPDDTSNYWSLSVKTGINHIKEQNLHPKVHLGTATAVVFNRYGQNKHTSDLELSILYSRPKTNFEPLAATINAQLGISYRKLFGLCSSAKTDFSAGPAAAIDYNISYYPNWDDSHLYWANCFAIGAAGKGAVRFANSKQLLFDAQLSALSFLSRPEADRQYKIDDLSFSGLMENFHSNTTFGTVNQSFSLKLKSEYIFLLTSKLSQSFTYQYSYSRQNSRSAALFENSIHTIGLKMYFL